MNSMVWPRGAERAARCAQLILERVRILENPYFESLVSGRMTLAEFARSQREFFHAVAEFSRPMLCLMARIPDPLDRLGMLDNVVEEHGHFDERRFHAKTFRDFCASLEAAGATSPQPPQQPGPAVDAFNLALWGVCQSAPVETALACLGTIEWAFAQIAARIGRVVVDRGWVPAERLVHYQLHAELDIEHAGQLFRPLESHWDDAEIRCRAARGMEVGAYIFDRLYRDLWAEATV